MALAPDNPIRPVLLVGQDTFKRDLVFVRHLLRRLADQDVPAFWVDCDPSGHHGPDLEELGPGGSFPEIDLPLMQSLNIRRLLLHLDRFGPSLLHCLSEDILPLTQTLAASLDVHVLVNVNHLQTRRNQLTISNRRCRVLAAPCASIRDSIVRYHSRYADRVVQITPWTQPPAEQSDGIERGMTPCLIVAADHASTQGMVLWLKCLQECQQLGRAFMVAMLVEADQETPIRRWLHELELDEIVTLISDGRVWPDVLRAGDAFIVPACLGRYDPRLTAAMAQGLTVIACAGGVDDWLWQDQTAWLVHEGNKADYHAVLRRFLEHRDQAHRLATTCRRRTQHTASGNAHSIDQWLELYQRATIAVDGLEVVG